MTVLHLLTTRLGLSLLSRSAVVTVLIADPETIPLWAVNYRNVSLMEHFPSHSCIDSVFSLNDSRLGVVHFFASMNNSTNSQIDDHSFSISDNGSVCAEVSLDYETKSVYTLLVLCRLQNTFASLLLPFQVSVIDISFPVTYTSVLNAT